MRNCENCYHFHMCDLQYRLEENRECKHFKDESLIDKALEKQIPKKPDYEDYDAKCPVCGHEFENNVNDWGCSYCQGCGQKLDWSDMNG